ncbi:hypothetical protein [Psychromonas sp. MME2]
MNKCQASKQSISRVLFYKHLAKAYFEDITNSYRERPIYQQRRSR